MPTYRVKSTVLMMVSTVVRADNAEDADAVAHENCQTLDWRSDGWFPSSDNLSSFEVEEIGEIPKSVHPGVHCTLCDERLARRPWHEWGNPAKPEMGHAMIFKDGRQALCISPEPPPPATAKVTEF